MNRSILIVAVSALALAACNTQTSNNDAAAALKPGTEAGINLAWMDKSVTPGDDFYGYADGGWMRTTEIPADRSTSAVSTSPTRCARRTRGRCSTTC